ncbi:MAG: SDR family NAD(P)-dependent oxidoreductase [Rhizobiaceae bacterium]|jgi:NAD(P)-dependent dehydrogenase (short-subunit alcohol dehydrogenase family)|nr:SDR family NAD(P)-dependent oxidoreductase [Rhizobiaceae bacterium]
MTEFSLAGRVALVTGASRGIGYHLALRLAARGAHVVAVARTQGGLEELDDAIRAGGGSATLVPLDVTDGPGVDRLGAAIHERWGKLDILAANAAILGVISPVGHVEAKVFEKVMAVNVTATWRVIRSVEPLLRASDAGRAAIISSGSAHSCRPFWSVYAASKAAVEAMGRCWAAETVNTALRVNMVEPGVARTAMRAQAVPGEDPNSIPHPSETAAGIMPVFDPTLRETGRLWSVRDMRFKDFRKPE